MPTFSKSSDREAREFSRASKPITPLEPSGYQGVRREPVVYESAPDWNFWQLMRTTELWKAVALSCDLEPRVYVDNAIGPGHREISHQKFMERMDIAKSHLWHSLKASDCSASAYEERFTVELDHFAAWALLIGVQPIPPQLAAMATKASDEPETKAPEDAGGEGEDGIHPRKENNYLRLILALAMDVPGFDPKKPYESAKLIIDHTSVSLEQKTLASYIRAAYDLQSKERG